VGNGLGLPQYKEGGPKEEDIEKVMDKIEGVGLHRCFRTTGGFECGKGHYELESVY